MSRQKSQTLLIWGTLVPAGARRMFVVLRGYIDESYRKDRYFTLSCLMSGPLEWKWFESRWKKVLSSKNRSLKKQGRKQITRYKAADSSSRIGEFSGWTIDEQIELTRSLLTVFKRSRLSWAVAYNVPLRDFVEVFPNERNPIETCYGFLLKFVMTEIASQIKDISKQVRVKPLSIVLIHDRGPFDHVLLESFNSFMNDPNFEGKKHFSTIAPMSSQECIPLQAADLLAYENFKEAERTVAGRKRRKTLELLLEMETFGGRARTFDIENLRKVREVVSRQTYHVSGNGTFITS